jgi:molybdate transport system regulatory protein
LTVKEVRRTFICMRKKKAGRTSVVLTPRLRVLCGGETALGPGRVDLLEWIGETGSLRAAAARMEMSYMRAWTLVKSLNSWFRAPLVEVVRGGRSGGGAKLTKDGREVIGLYRRIERESERAAGRPWKNLRRFLKQ